MIKLVAFDLDGTLTQHKTPLDPKNKRVLDALAKKYSLLMVGAGSCERIHKQMGEYPIDIIGNYGLQFAEYDKSTGKLKMVRDLSFDCDREAAEEKISILRQKHGFTEYSGKSVEYHASGCITFPILGTTAKQEDKLSFDPDRKKRRAFLNEVRELFPEYTVFVGGSSSFDMAPKPYNKYYALDLYCKEHGLTHDQVAYIGDDYGLGGNVESVYKSDFVYLTIDNYLDFPKVVTPLL